MSKETRYTIRPLTIEDFDQYVLNRREALATNPEAFLTTLEEFDARPAEMLRKRHIKTVTDVDSGLIGAFDGETLVGQTGYFRHAHPAQQRTVTIFGVFLSPAVRGLGLGRRLMAAAETEISQIDGIDSIELSVKRDNISAVGLYQALGYSEFVPAADHPVHATACSTEIQMRKAIGASAAVA